MSTRRPQHEILADLQDDGDHFAAVTGAVEAGGTLYVASLFGPHLGALALSEGGRLP